VAEWGEECEGVSEAVHGLKQGEREVNMRRQTGLFLLVLILLMACAPAPHTPTPVPSVTPEVSPTPAAVQEALVGFELSEVASSGKAVGFHSITFIDRDGHSTGELTFGTPEVDDLLEDGWLETEESPGIGTIRWAGGPSGIATMRLAIPERTEGLLLNVTSIVDGIWMNVTVDGELAATLLVDAYWHSGYAPIAEAVPESMPDVQPEWIEGRYFPRFPPTERLYALPVRTTLAEDYPGSWEPGWRINDSHNDMMALTLVGMQGVINRGGPRVYLDWNDYWGNSRFWMQELEGHVDVVHLNLDGLSALNFLMRRYASRFSGAVVYDPDVPDTINLATMIAGLEDRIILAPEQIGLPGIPDFDSVTDLRQLVQEQGWEATAQGQYEIYQWVHENLWAPEDNLQPQLEHRIIGVISPGPPTSMEPGDAPGSFWPLGMASRDYMVALRLPAIYLSPVAEPQAGLFARFLEDAPSPIVITGGVSGYEEETTGLASRYGDWQAAISWPGGILNSGSLTVFSGVRPAVQPYQPEMDADRILGTLGDSPVATMFCTDGDSINYLMQRGFNESFGWVDVNDQRFGWTINPTLAEIAPLIWNYYVESSSEASLLTGLSGAGYVYPQLMSGEELDAYLEHTARYLDETGLRVVRVDGRKGPWTEELATHYYQGLREAGYLGAIFGYGGSSRGLGFEHTAVPAPAVWPAYTIRSQNEASIVEDILARNPGEEFVDITSQYICPDCQMVQDADASQGQAALVPREFSNSPSCCLAVMPGPMSLPPGEYTVTFRMKVANNQDTEPFAAIYVGETPRDWRQIEYQSVAPSDFEEADRYQDFTLSFTLERLTPEVEFRIDYWRGATELYVDTIHAVRSDGPAMPVFATVLIALMLDPSEFEYQARAPERFTVEFERGGGIVLTPDEFMAALNPEFMIDWATPILGSESTALAEARAQLEAGEFLQSLLTVRQALRTPPERAYVFEVEVEGREFTVQVRANAWVTDFTFDDSGRQLSFRTHGPPEGTVQAAIIIPHELLAGPFVVNVDGQPHDFSDSQDETHTTLNFEFAQGPHQVVVAGE
jgi:hypothetical protein